MEIKIYKITNSCNEKIYIGQTTRELKKRMYDHITKANAGIQRKFHLAIAELGKDNFKIEQIAIATNRETADKLETFFITSLDTIKSGYNTIDRASGSFNRGTANGMSGMKGKLSPIAREIISINYDDTIKEWESISSFCEVHPNFDVRNVQAVAAGKRAVCHEYTFFYKEEFSEEKVEAKRALSKQNRRITLLDKNGKLIKHFKGLEEAAVYMKQTKINISCKITNNKKNKDGSYFVYDLKIFK